MDKATELSFGLDTVRRSAEFKLGMLARRSGLLSLASWIKSGGRDRLVITVPESPAPGAIIDAIHSRDGEPAIPWDLVDVRGQYTFADCPASAYGQALCIQHGTLRVQVTPSPVIVARRAPGAPRIHVHLDRAAESIDLACEQGGLTLIRPGFTPMVADPRSDHPPHAHTNGRAPAKLPWSPAERTFVEDVESRALDTATVFVPRWLGVTSSTRVLFDGAAAFYPFPATTADSPWEVTDAQVEHHAEVLAASGVSRVIFSGGDEIHYRLMVALHRRDQRVRFDMVFHGNFVQLQDPYVWKIFNLWIDAAQSGLLHTFVTVKQGFDEVLTSMGVRNQLLLNYIPGPTQPPPAIPADPPRVGIWTSGTFYKCVNPMLVALKLMPGATLHAAGIGDHGIALAQRLEVPAGFVREHPVKRDELMQRIRETHLSLYVTTAECSPMLPLESLQLGVPCLIGPCSHLFQDHEYLFDRLVVPFPDRPEVIARYARRAFDEREQIIRAWAEYSVRYNADARARVQRFLQESAAPALA